MKKLLLLLLFITSVTAVCAEGFGGALRQEADSLDADSPTSFRYYKLIAPSSPIVLGSLSLYVSSVERFDNTSSDSISSGHGFVTFDDYLQYSPIAIMWGLNAFGGSGLRPYHSMKQQSTILVMSTLTALALVRGTKSFVSRRRPDSSAMNSFPSGHTATAFMGAEMLHQEFGDSSAWISVAGYSIASLTAFMRVYNGRHYITDVVAGAGVGVLSTRLAYWLSPRVNRWLWGSETGYEEPTVTATLAPSVVGDNYGVALSIRF